MKNIEKKAIIDLKYNIGKVFKDTKKSLGNNIFRGHTRSISTDVEDYIAVFISELLPKNYTIMLDPTITIGTQKRRPDLVIIDDENVLFAILEIKSNTGYCRIANHVLDSILNFKEQLSIEKNFKCQFSSGEAIEVVFSDKVKLFFVSLTDFNNNEKNHLSNKNYAETLGIHYLNLFTNWYENLKDKDIREFVELIK